MRRMCVSGLLLTFTLFGCGDDGGSSAKAPDAAAELADADPSDPCTGVCALANEGSTQFEDVRVREHGIPSLIADVLLAATRAASGEDIDVYLANGGAIRAGFVDDTFAFSTEEGRVGTTFSGALSSDDIKGWFPFPNEAVALDLTGAQLKRTLESSVKTWRDDAGLNFGPDLNNDKGGEFLHVSGMSFEVTCAGTTRIVVGPADCNPFDKSAPCSYQNPDAANSVTRMTVGEVVVFDAADGGWQGTGETDTFRVATSNFIADGLDNHLDLPEGTNKTVLDASPFPSPLALVDYFLVNSPVMLDHDQGRITVVGDVNGIACNLPSTCIPLHADHPNCAHL